MTSGKPGQGWDGSGAGGFQQQGRFPRAQGWHAAFSALFQNIPLQHGLGPAPCRLWDVEMG